MAIRPIIFAAPMVRALLDGRKTQTRRVLADHHIRAADDLPSQIQEDLELSGWEFFGQHWCKTPYAPGDLLWVRESFKEAHPIAFPKEREGERLLYAGIPGPPAIDYLVAYRADGELLPYWHSDAYPYRQLQPRDDLEQKLWPEGVETGWMSPIHMPRKASRLSLRVTDVRVDRVQEISCADAIAEGIPIVANSQSIDCETPDPRHAFRSLWNAINASRGFGWEANPWVVALTFTVIRANVDAEGTPS